MTTKQQYMLAHRLARMATADDSYIWRRLHAMPAQIVDAAIYGLSDGFFWNCLGNNENHERVDGRLYLIGGKLFVFHDGKFVPEKVDDTTLAKVS